MMSSGLEFERLTSLCGDDVGVGIKHATVVTYKNLKEEKKWFHVEIHFDQDIKRPYLIVKYNEESYNRIVMPVYDEEELSPKDIHNIFNLLHPPGDPESYEDGLIMALVSSDMSIVYHNVCTGLIPPTIKPTSSIPRSRQLKKIMKERRTREKDEDLEWEG